MLVQRQLILVGAWTRHASFDCYRLGVTIVELAFELEGLGALPYRVQWIVSSRGWHRVVRSQLGSVKNSFREALAPCAKTIGSVSLAVNSEGRSGVIGLENSWNVISVG